jgi:hypothetical protein
LRLNAALTCVFSRRRTAGCPTNRRARL